MRNILLNGIWLAVVLSGMGLVLFRFEEYGWWGVGAILVGVSMLVIFSVTHLRATGRGGETARRVSDYATGAAILGAIVVLAVSLVESVRRRSIVPALVLVLFLSVFLRIARDYARYLKKSGQAERDA